MRVPRIVYPLLAVALVAGSWRAWGWAGVAFAAGGIVMWMLLHLNRMLMVMRRAARRPIGHVDSAVMLQARLQKNMPLLEVIALSRALGRQESATDAQPEVFTWTDPGGAAVRCEFAQGRLAAWDFTRPAGDTGVPGPPAAP